MLICSHIPDLQQLKFLALSFGSEKTSLLEPLKSFSSLSSLTSLQISFDSAVAESLISLYKNITLPTSIKSIHLDTSQASYFMVPAIKSKIQSFMHRLQQLPQLEHLQLDYQLSMFAHNEEEESFDSLLIDPIKEICNLKILKIRIKSGLYSHERPPSFNLAKLFQDNTNLMSQLQEIDLSFHTLSLEFFDSSYFSHNKLRANKILLSGTFSSVKHFRPFLECLQPNKFADSEAKFNIYITNEEESQKIFEACTTQINVKKVSFQIATKWIEDEEVSNMMLNFLSQVLGPKELILAIPGKNLSKDYNLILSILKVSLNKPEKITLYNGRQLSKCSKFCFEKLDQTYELTCKNIVNGYYEDPDDNGKGL